MAATVESVPEDSATQVADLLRATIDNLSKPVNDVELTMEV